MNTSDAERVSTVCERNGFVQTDDWRDSDMLIYVSCSIKQKAEDKIVGHMKELEQMKKTNPNLRVGISGCMVRTTSSQDDEDKDKILKVIPTVDFVFRMEDLDQLDYMLRDETSNDLGKNFGDPEYLNTPPKISSGHRGYLPIMSGCDNFCTFCIVPYSRGRERSRLLSEILNDAKRMAKEGVTELLLLGQNVNSFGNKNDVYDEIYQDDEQHQAFTRLLMELNKVDGIRRIKYTSPNPKDITEELIIKMAELDKVCEYVHLPVQSGDDAMLKRMNRHYSTEHFLSLVDLIRKHMPRAGITTDVIVGFSGENEEQHQNTVKLCESARFDLSYTSQYSERRQTYAGRFLKDDVSKEEKNRRYHEVNDVIRKTSHEINKQYVGEIWEVLVDDIKDGLACGKTRTARSVRFPVGEEVQTGDYVEVIISNGLEWVLEGEPVTVTLLARHRSLRQQEVVSGLEVVAA